MRITPLDVRKQEFRRVVRGVDADEVHAFLATVADEYEAVLTDNKQLREKLMELDEKVGEYRTMERTLRDTLLTAERVMTEARQNARKEAELILRDAQLRASQATNNIEQRVDALRSQLRELRGQRDAFLARMQSLAEAQVGLVGSYRKDFASDDERSERLMRDPESGVSTASRPVDRRDVDSRVEAPSTPPVVNPIPNARVYPGAGEPNPSTGSANDDAWRGYQVDHRSHPTAGPHSGRHPVLEDEVNGAVEHVLAIHQGSAGPNLAAEDLFEAGPVANDFGPPSGQWTPPVPTYSGPEPIDPERMQAQVAGDEILPPAASHAADGSSQPSEETSRWSLSRFTRGLSGL